MQRAPLSLAPVAIKFCFLSLAIDSQSSTSLSLSPTPPLPEEEVPITDDLSPVSDGKEGFWIALSVLYHC